MKIFLLVLPLLLIPFGASASGVPYFMGGGSVLVATSTPANVYAVGGSVVVTTPTRGDLTAAGGSLALDGSIAGDTMVLGGSIHLAAPALGDVRLLGGRISITEPVTGDLVVIGGSVRDSGGGASNTFIVGGEVALTNGARGPVTIIGSSVSLGGSFANDVEVTAGSHLALLPDTTIQGELRYQAPQEATIPASAKVIGGVHYTGTSYLPTTEEARAIAFASFGVFLFVKILGSLILAGLIAGLFPLLAAEVISRATRVSVRKALLTFFLGFAIIVAIPVLLVALAVTFVGLGLAVIIGLAYLLLIPLALLYAAVVIGSYLARFIFKRTVPRWSDAVVGMLVLFVLWSLPFVGSFCIALIFLYMVGVLVSLMYRFAFPRDTELA